MMFEGNRRYREVRREGEIRAVRERERTKLNPDIKIK